MLNGGGHSYLVPTSSSHHQFLADNFTANQGGLYSNGSGGTTLLQQQYSALEPHDQSLEDLLTMVGGDDGQQQIQQHSSSLGNTVHNNIITILSKSQLTHHFFINPFTSSF